MRTRSAAWWGQGSATRVRWARSAASIACVAVAKAAQKASPTVLKTKPPASSMAVRMSSSWRRRAPAMASGSLSHRRVDPSMSLKSSVTVPEGITMHIFARRSQVLPGLRERLAGADPFI
jgi:hypothetical protein